jgi:nucleoside-diphosphate-sugar epimerase
MRVLIIGCGYVGLPLAAELVRQGHEVFGVRRSEASFAEMTEVGVTPIAADITQRENLQRIQGPFDWVVNTTSSSGGGVEDYHRVYLEGNRNLIEWLAANPPKKFVYTSSTSVYGQDDGSVVKENSVADPASDTGKVLVQTEKLLLDAARDKKVPAVVLRVAGIYGPDRGHFFQQYMRNEAKIPGKGDRVTNMIHQTDLIGAIIAALKNARAGEIYNVVDDEPVAHVHFFRWLSETLGKYMPPFAPEEEGVWKKRGVTNKKVSNRRLKMELGYQFKYPTFRQGYTAEIQRLENAGKFNPLPDPR